MNIDHLIIGNCPSSSYNKSTQYLIDRIANGQDFPLNESTFASTDSTFLAVLLLNYPLVYESYYREFSVAVKKISQAKYNCCKKSSAFKESFNKHLNELFNKFHSSDLTEQKDQIHKVNHAVALIRYIGELYNVNYIVNCNIKFFLEILIKAAETSKISENCLLVFIATISDHAKNEAKQFHKHNHDVHTAAIMKILAEYEGSFDGASAYNSNKKKKNYKDLEIIEAVKKMEKNNKNAKTSHNNNNNNNYSIKNHQANILSKNEVTRQTKKIFETILTGYISIATCVQTAHDIFLLCPDSFEHEMFQLCLEYLKKGLTNIDDNNSNNFTAIGKFIGKLYCADVFKSDTIKSTMSLLSKFEQVESSKDVHDAILNAIYFKVMENNDEVLKHLIPNDFEGIASDDGETESDESFTETTTCKEEAEIKHECKKEEKRPATKTLNGAQLSTVVTVAFNVSPIDKFKNLMTKLQPANVAYMLREIPQIQFANNNEETIMELTSILVELALKKQSLIKAVVQICLKLPDTVSPHFNNALMKKSLKAVISTSVIGCSEQKALGCSQLVKELHIAGIYDRFDIILVLENFTAKFDNDRTALSSLLKFTDELKDLINNNKKLSKNMSFKLKRIGQNLQQQLNNENYVDYKPAIEMAVKVYNGEYRTRIIVNHQQDNKQEDEEVDDEEEELVEHRDPEQFLVGNLLLRYPSRKVSPVQYPNMSSPPPPLPQPCSTEIVIVNNEMPSLYASPPPPPPFRSFTPERDITRSTSDSSSVEELNRQHSEGLYSTVLESGQANASFVSLSSDESILNDDDDQFFDSQATNDCFDNDKEFKLLEECTKNGDGELRELIFHQMSEVSDFVPTMLLMGSKFQIDSFMMLFEIVEEALRKQQGNENAHDKFKKCLELKIPDFLSRLWNETSQTAKDKNEMENLVIITGVLYNKNYLSDEFYQKILETVWKEIENAFHAIIFIRLITTSATKIAHNGLFLNACKNYLENLAEFNHSFGNSEDRQILLREIGTALKIFSVNNKEVKKKPAVAADPTVFYKNLIAVLDANNLSQIINQTKSITTLKKSEMMTVMDSFLATTIRSEQPQSIYIKVAEKLKNASASDAPAFTFKLCLEEKLKEEFSKCLDDKKNMELAVLKWTSFVGDLFLSNVVTIQLLASIFEALFERENDDLKIVDAIGLLMKKIGSKVDEQNDTTFEKFFSYFSLLTASENSYRTGVYKELIKLRKNKWKDGKNDARLIEHFLSQLRHDNIVEVCKLIGEKLGVSAENCNEFINLLWKAMMKNPHREIIYKYARLIQGLTFFNGNILKQFMEFMTHRNNTFCSIPIQNFSDAISTKLAFTIHFMCYLYAIDLATETDLIKWIRPNLVQHLSIAQNAELSILLGPKLNGCSNVNVKAFFTYVEFNVKDQFVKAFNNVLEDIITFN